MLRIYNDLRQIAVTENGINYTYDEFIQTVDNIIKVIKNKNVKRILIDLPQCYLGYCIIWASYITNTPFCCINNNLPENYKKYCINTFKPNIVLRSKGDLVNIPPKMLFPDEEVKLVTENTAYVLFTSGSTGTPKGVSVKRSALENFVTWCSGHYSLSSDDVYGQYSNISFDLGVGDVFLGISRGAKMVPITGLQKLLPGQAIKNNKITFWHSVPSVIDLIIKRGDIQSGALSTLKEITFCGESLYPSQVETLFKFNKNLKIWNTYGPTEATIFCSAILLNNENYRDLSDPTVTIGEPIDGFEFQFVENKDNQKELLIYSNYVASGYINDVNNDGFLYNDHTGESYGFKTGDIVKLVKNKVFFVGRIDSQIKIGGYRVDLNEIDAIIRKKTFFTSCTIFYQNKIITFIEATDSYNENLVLSVIEENLPNYYKPSKIVVIPNLPKNINGKYDKKKLVEKYDSYIE